MASQALQYRGVIEGFLGPMWSHEDRLHLIRHLRGWHMNLFIYSPRDDPYHRFCWDAPYPAEDMARFTELAEEARRQDVQFAYAISPGNTFRPHDPAHRLALLEKLQPFIDLGSTFFPILYDDLVEEFDPHSAAGERHADMQAEVMNALADGLTARCPEARFLFCPTYYMTAEKLPYLVRLHERLDPRIETVVTGVDPDSRGIIPRTFSDEGARRYYDNFGRRPFLWDNFNVHDRAMNALHWTPYTGRGAHLNELCSGIVLNPQNIYLYNLPIFACMSDYFADPRAYDPRASMRRHLSELMGEQALPAGLVLSQWFTAECADYHSSEENLPPLDEAMTLAQRNDLLAKLRETFLPLRDFGLDFNRTRLDPKLASFLLPFANLLQRYARLMVDFCTDTQGRAVAAPEAVANLSEQMAGIERYYFRLPASLVEYTKRLGVICAKQPTEG